MFVSSVKGGTNVRGQEERRNYLWGTSEVQAEVDLAGGLRPYVAHMVLKNIICHHRIFSTL